MGGSKPKPSVTFDTANAERLNAENTAKLNQYQLERESLLGAQNTQMANYFGNVSSLANQQQNQNVQNYTNALQGYQGSLNQNTAQANSLLQQQRNYYDSTLAGQQQYQNNFTGLLSQAQQAQAAQNANYQQNYLNQQGQYNQDNTAQQQQFMQQYLGQMGSNRDQLTAAQQGYQQQYANTANQLSQIKTNAASRQSAVKQQEQQKSNLTMFQEWEKARKAEEQRRMLRLQPLHPDPNYQANRGLYT